MKTRRVEARFDDGKSLNYRKVSTKAVLSLVLGIASIVTFLGVWWLLVPIGALLIGWLALDQIHQTPRDLSGIQLAKAGIICACLLGGAGATSHLVKAISRVPWGYQEVTYQDLQPENKQLYSSQAEKLNGKKVYIEGYISPSRQTTNLKKFFICPVVSHCKACIPDPKPTEMIEVKLTGDMSANYTIHVVHVGGWLIVDPANPAGTPYTIEADFFR